MATVDSKLPAFNPRLRIPKCWLVGRLLRYSHAAGRACSSCIYRSIGLFGGYFGIRIPPAGQTLAAFTEVTKILRCTSVIPSTQRYSNCLIYGSKASFSPHFRNLVNPDAPPAASFTEVWQVFLSTSVISSTRHYLQLPHLRKYSKFSSPLP